MAKKFINCHEWDKIFGNILNRGSTLADEAEKLGLNQETLELQGAKKWGADPKWAKVKRESERHEKAQNRKKGRNPTPTVSVPAPTPTASAPAPTTPAPTTPDHAPTSTTPSEKPSVEVESDKPEELEELEAKKVSMTSEIVEIEEKLAKARQVADARTETARLAAVVSGKAKHAYEEAKKALEESEEAWRNAKAEADEATGEVAKIEAEKAEIKAELQDLDSEISRIKAGIIFLVAPGYAGPWPNYGRLVSATEMEVPTEIQEAEESNCPQMSIMEASSYFRDFAECHNVLAFIGLVTQYVMEDKSFRLLVSDGTVSEKLVKKFIG